MIPIRLRPSKADEWMNCAVSQHRAATLPEEESNPFADEGTCAHGVALAMFKGEVPSAANVPFFDLYYNDEMQMHVDEYVEFVNKIIASRPGSFLLIEQPLVVSKLFNIEGTGDVVIIDPINRQICGIDLKYGQGVEVYADCLQLRMYGIGALLEFDFMFNGAIESVTTIIYQPRRNHIDSHTYEAKWLKDWFEASQDTIEAAFLGKGPATPGEHCRWCGFRKHCVERAEYIARLAGSDFASFAEAPIGVMPSPETVPIEQLIPLFKSMPLVLQYMKDVESRVSKEARQTKLPGLKWVAGRAIRKIADEDVARGTLEAMGINPMEEKFRGVPSLEKELKAKGHKDIRQVIDIELHHSKAVLVDESDRRQEIVPTEIAKEDFEE